SPTRSSAGTPIVVRPRSATRPPARAFQSSPWFTRSWSTGWLFPERGARRAALPHLRTLGRRAAPAERAGTAVARSLRPPRVKDPRLVGARARPAVAAL